ncbi:divalent metal cation transporter [Hymenobacter sp. RP-2-7]|uniref:Divalent metal cation transporter n=1 Tax=Hymenobacter polaris TaxID=2682546 RepID=A0A7Y0AH24_9BACT|nr:NRAMP family divalent metal transporter [Hymenobacter polaris]NML67165.1 divalent metal cation transporter [Hymenobacter polaris]
MSGTLGPTARRWRSLGGAGLGAAFLMANSSIGPGFLTQTTVFTQQLTTSFGFVILVSVLLDVVAQLNTWRVLTMSNLRAQDLANCLLPGLGYALAALVVLGGFAFNIGNIAGCGLGLNVLLGLPYWQGAVLTGGLALGLFWVKEMGRMLDGFTKALGTIKILLTLGIAFLARPPLGQALHHTLLPAQFSAPAIVTIVGGTVGGYLMFSGAHRLLDAGVHGPARLPEVNRSAVSGILISAFMRFVLFLAVVGVLAGGARLGTDNPMADVFRSAAGAVGYRLFGLILWGAALSSVVGAAYTSVSFLKTLHPALGRHERLTISLFIVLSTSVFVLVGKPTQLLVLAGALNGLILPLALGVVLVAARRPALLGGYRHPLWLQAAGWAVVALMGGLSVAALMG